MCGERWICEICDKRLLGSKVLARHYRNAHNDEQRAYWAGRCTICLKRPRFESPAALGLHLVEAHISTAPYKRRFIGCLHCDARFTHFAPLADHLGEFHRQLSSVPEEVAALGYCRTCDSAAKRGARFRGMHTLRFKTWVELFHHLKTTHSRQK